MTKLRPPRNRAHRCFELSSRYLIEDERYNDGLWSLVHGTLTTNKYWYTHAWLSSDQGRVYDPVRDKQYSWDEYVAKFKASPKVTYTKKEAAIMNLKHNHFGPWEISGHPVGPV